MGECDASFSARFLARRYTNTLNSFCTCFVFLCSLEERISRFRSRLQKSLIGENFISRHRNYQYLILLVICYAFMWKVAELTLLFHTADFIYVFQSFASHLLRDSSCLPTCLTTGQRVIWAEDTSVPFVHLGSLGSNVFWSPLLEFRLPLPSPVLETIVCLFCYFIIHFYTGGY